MNKKKRIQTNKKGEKKKKGKRKKGKRKERKKERGNNLNEKKGKKEK